MAIYVKYGDLEGDVTATGHEGWIEVDSFNFGCGRGTQMTVGASQERESSVVNFREIDVSTSMDKCSPQFMIDAACGTAKKVDIHFVQTQADELLTYYEIVLSDVLCNNYSLSGGMDRPVETISFAYKKIEVKYTPFDDKNNPGTPVPAGYDLVTARKL